MHGAIIKKHQVVFEFHKVCVISDKLFASVTCERASTMDMVICVKPLHPLGDIPFSK